MRRPAQAFSLSSSAASFCRVVGAAHPLDDRLRCAATSLVQHALLDASADAPDASRSCAGPARAAAASAATSPAISPHTAIGTFALSRRADRQRRSASAPPDAADRRDATRRRRRDRRRACTGSGRWCRSTGSRACAGTRAIASTAAGISIMPPTSTSRIERHALLAQALLRLRDHRQRLVDLADRREHRHAGSARCRSATRAGSRGAA